MLLQVILPSLNVDISRDFVDAGGRHDQLVLTSHKLMYSRSCLFLLKVFGMKARRRDEDVVLRRALL